MYCEKNRKKLRGEKCLLQIFSRLLAFCKTYCYTHALVFLFSTQVACTNWKRVMVLLSQSLISPSSGKPYTNPEAIPPDLVHNSSLHLTFAKYDTHKQFKSTECSIIIFYLSKQHSIKYSSNNQYKSLF